MARKKKLNRGDVLEVILDDDDIKGYLVFLDIHHKWKTHLFGLVGIEPRLEGHTIEELVGKEYVAQIMASVDPEWRKVGKLVLPDIFVWPDLYYESLSHKGKFSVYRYGESVPFKEFVDFNDLEGAQPDDIYFPGALIIYYRKVLRQHGFYHKPEPTEKPKEPMSEEAEMSFAGVYGDVWSYYRSQVNEKKKEAQIATRATIKKFADELTFPDTGLQLYMGIAKAQLDFNDILPEIKDEVLKRIEEEKDYLNREEWLSNQADKIKELLE